MKLIAIIILILVLTGCDNINVSESVEESKYVISDLVIGNQLVISADDNDSLNYRGEKNG